MKTYTTKDFFQTMKHNELSLFNIQMTKILLVPKNASLLHLLYQFCTLDYCFLNSYRFSNFTIVKVVKLNLFASFLQWCHILVHGFFSKLLPIQFPILISNFVKAKDLALFLFASLMQMLCTLIRYYFPHSYYFSKYCGKIVVSLCNTKKNSLLPLRLRKRDNQKRI